MPSRLQALSRRLGPDGAASLALFAVFVALYSCSVDLSSVNLLWHNFVFDADLDRVVADASGRQNAMVFGRHPLFVLTVAGPASLLSALGFSPVAALRTLVAVASAAGVVAAHAVFHRILRDRSLALAFAVLYGCSSTVWLLSSVPETFALGASSIALCFFAVNAGSSDGRARRRHLVAFSLFSALSIGVTVSNAMYVGLACGLGVWRANLRARIRLALVSAYAALVAVLFVALSLFQRAAFGVRVGHATGVVNPLGAAADDTFLNVHRAFSLSEAVRLFRAFLVDHLVAPGPVIEVVNTAAGPSQMIQYGDWTRPSYVLGVLLLGSLVFVAARGAPLRSVVRAPEAQLAASYLVFNLVLHYFYRANGQPFIFSVHTALPVLVLLAVFCANRGEPSLRPLVVIATLAVVANSVFFVARVRDALALPCETKVGVICTAWAGSPDARHTRGLDRYLASGWHAAELGRTALEEGRAEEAVQLYRAALVKDRQLLWAERDLGLTLLQLGQRPEAAMHLEHVVARAPDDLLARQALGSLRR